MSSSPKRREVEFGARDPFPQELVLGPADTEHLIKPPDKLDEVLGLKSRKCKPCEGGMPSLTEKEIELMRNQIPGWQIITQDGIPRIKSEWTTKGFKSALKLFDRVGIIAEEEGHHPDLHLTSYNRVMIELSTHSVNGLTENDFIIAAKINELDLTDLLKKKKPIYWA